MLKSVCAGVALSAVASLGGAHAAVVTITYAGLMEQGTDATNAFGTSASSSATDVDLANLPVLVTYVFDLSQGRVSSGPGAISITGGTFNGQSSPALRATVTINSHNVSFAGDALGIIAASTIFGGSHLGQTVQSASGDSAYSSVDAPAGTFASSIATPLTLDSQVQSFTALTVFDLSNGASGDFYARSVSVSVVPLPSSLPLFALGLLGAGAATAIGRRRLGAQR